MHFRCHERQRQKAKTSVLKSSLKISTDNLCGPSKRGVTIKRSNEGYQIWIAEGLQKIKFFLYRRV